MRRIILGLLLLPLYSHAQDATPETIERLKKLYPDQTEEFIKERVSNAPTPFNKWRSFPPYYYEMMNRSTSADLFKARKGLCAGDAHLENFGFIPESNKKSIFALNDLDDVTECSLDLDLMRLFVGQRLTRKELKTEDFLRSYQRGLSGEACPAPKFIKKLEASSIQKAKGLSKKNKALLESKTCEGEYEVLTSSEKEMLDKFVQSEQNVITCHKHEILNSGLNFIARKIALAGTSTIVHACSRTKSSGGSAGGKRFVVFKKSAGDEIEAFELKPLMKPASDYSISVENEKREELFKRAVETYFTPSMKEHFYPVVMSDILYQRRPLWNGNEAVKTEDVIKKDDSQLEPVMLYETCHLGLSHKRSNDGDFTISAKDWEAAAQSIEKQFKGEFGH